jgi:DNA-binding NarL/FixJ family response regulator
MTIRVLIADDQAKVRFALHVLLESKPDVEIVGEAEDAEDLQSLVKTTNPAVVILDWLLPGLLEVGSIGSLRESGSEIFVIALSGRPELGQEALIGGADAFISKIDPPDRLLEVFNQYEATLIRNQSEVSEGTSS